MLQGKILEKDVLVCRERTEYLLCVFCDPNESIDHLMITCSVSFTF
jgi:hypothetical protein